MDKKKKKNAYLSPAATSTFCLLFVIIFVSSRLILREAFRFSELILWFLLSKGGMMRGLLLLVDLAFT